MGCRDRIESAFDLGLASRAGGATLPPVNDETYIIAKGSHGAMKSTQKLLTSNGIDAEIVQPPGADMNQ